MFVPTNCKVTSQFCESSSLTALWYSVVSCGVLSCIYSDRNCYDNWRLQWLPVSVSLTSFTFLPEGHYKAICNIFLFQCDEMKDEIISFCSKIWFFTLVLMLCSLQELVNLVFLETGCTLKCQVDCYYLGFLVPLSDLSLGEFEACNLCTVV